MLPPFKEHGIANKLKPWCKLQFLVLKHALELVLSNIFVVLHLILVDMQVYVGFDEEDVVDCSWSATQDPRALKVTKAHSHVRPTCRH